MASAVGIMLGILRDRVRLRDRWWWAEVALPLLTAIAGFVLAWLSMGTAAGPPGTGTGHGGGIVLGFVVAVGVGLLGSVLTARAITKREQEAHLRDTQHEAILRKQNHLQQGQEATRGLQEATLRADRGHREASRIIADSPNRYREASVLIRTDANVRNPEVDESDAITMKVGALHLAQAIETWADAYRDVTPSAIALETYSANLAPRARGIRSAFAKRNVVDVTLNELLGRTLTDVGQIRQVAAGLRILAGLI